MKQLLFLLLLFACTQMFAQRSTDTTITAYTGTHWNVRFTTPKGYDDPAHAGRTYKMIVFYPGLGQTGSNIKDLVVYGPHAYITQGWNGRAQRSGSDSVDFIVVSVQPLAPYPSATLQNTVLEVLRTRFRAREIYLTGLSHGGWCVDTYVTAEAAYAAKISANVTVEGMKIAATPYPQVYDKFVLAGGKYMGYNQVNDGGRDYPGRINQMNLIVPHSAIYYNTSFGDGTHCCFEFFYGGMGQQPTKQLYNNEQITLYEFFARLGTADTPPVESDPDLPILDSKHSSIKYNK